MDTYKEIGKLLSSNEYPGRGIILGTSPDGTKAVAAYFIMAEAKTAETVYLKKEMMKYIQKPLMKAKWRIPPS